MSMQAIFDGVDGGQVASNLGWGDFGRWVDGLDAETFNQVVHLWEHGWCQELADLTEQLGQALAESPPDLPGVADTVTGLLAMSQEYPDAEVVTITDGLTPEEPIVPFVDAARGIVALRGVEKDRIEDLLSEAIRSETEVLLTIARQVVTRLVMGDSGAMTETEVNELADSFSRVNATANLLGRTRVRERHGVLVRGSDDRDNDGVPGSVRGGQRDADGTVRFVSGGSDRLQTFTSNPGVPLLAPDAALDYFRSLVPALNVQPARFGPQQRRDAFTLALATSQTVLTSVQEVILARLRDGEPSGPQDIDDILTQAGIAPTNPQYAEMVYRTNAMDSYNVGAQEELADPEVRSMFPVWQYLGIDDERAGDDHRPKFNRYYPAHVPFTQVRGDRVYNCRCTFALIDRYEWADLQARGAKLETTW